MSSVMGEAELLRNINKLSVDLSTATDEAVFATANDVRNFAVKSIQKESFGTWVTRTSQGGKQYSHVASRPGDAPNTDTGALVRSIAVEHSKGSQIAYVGTTLEYGKYLEFGTRDMNERPWLQPALDAMVERFRNNLARAVQRQLDKVGK